MKFVMIYVLKAITNAHLHRCYPQTKMHLPRLRIGFFFHSGAPFVALRHTVAAVKLSGSSISLQLQNQYPVKQLRDIFSVYNNYGNITKNGTRTAVVLHNVMRGTCIKEMQGTCSLLASNRLIRHFE